MNEDKSQLTIYILIALVAIGAGVYFFMPSSAPLCADPAITKTVSKMYLRSRIEQIHTNPGHYFNEDKTTFSRLNNQNEIYYDKESDTRYCTANAVFATYSDNNERTEADMGVGYIISPSKDDYQLQLQDKDYIITTYGNKGKTSLQNSPISPEQVKAAVTSSIAALEGPALSHRSKGPETMSQSIKWLTFTDKCQQQAENNYTCPVLIGYHDSLMETLNKNPNLKLKFDVTLAKENDSWITTGDFHNIFLRAVVDARLVNTLGQEVVDKMKENERKKQLTPETP